MKSIALAAFGIQLFLGNICMMPTASAESMQEDSSMQMMTPMQSVASHSHNESESSPAQKGGCNGHCFSQVSSTPVSTAFAAQEIVASTIATDIFQGIDHDGIAVGPIIYASPPGFLSTDTTVLRL